MARRTKSTMAGWTKIGKNKYRHVDGHEVRKVNFLWEVSGPNKNDGHRYSTLWVAMDAAAKTPARFVNGRTRRKNPYGYIIAGRTRPHAYSATRDFPYKDRSEAKRVIGERVRAMGRRGDDVAFDAFLTEPRGRKIGKTRILVSGYARNPIYHYRHRYDSKQPWKRDEVFAEDYDFATQLMMKRHPDEMIDLDEVQHTDVSGVRVIGPESRYKMKKKVWRPSRKRLLRPRARNVSKRRFGRGSSFPMRTFGVWMSGGKTRTVKAHTANEAAAKAAGGPVIGTGGSPMGPMYFTSRGGRGNSIKVWPRSESGNPMRRKRRNKKRGVTKRRKMSRLVKRRPRNAKGQFSKVKWKRSKRR